MIHMHIRFKVCVCIHIYIYVYIYIYYRYYMSPYICMYICIYIYEHTLQYTSQDFRITKSTSVRVMFATFPSGEEGSFRPSNWPPQSRAPAGSPHVPVSRSRANSPPVFESFEKKKKKKSGGKTQRGFFERWKTKLTDFFW